MILINGVAEQRIDASDRGLHYGDGIFTTLRVRDGRAALLDRHLARLRADSARLGLPAPDEIELRAEVARVCAGVARGVLKILITRGSGGRGYRPPQPAQTTRIVQLHPWPEEITGERVLRICTTRLSAQPRLAGVKHLNRLEQVLARMEWDDRAIADGVMLDDKDRVIETVSANLFAVFGTALVTPRLDRCGVRGVMRDTVRELARNAGIVVDERDLHRDTLAQAREVFTTNSVTGLRSVRRIDRQDYPSSEICTRLQIALNQLAPEYA